MRKDVQPGWPMAIPEMAGPRQLEDLIPIDSFVGTSLILRQDGRLLYGMRPIREVQKRPLIELTGIGGGIEEVDETYASGVLREAREEIGCGEGAGAGCRVKLLPCDRTLVVRGQEQMEWAKLQGPQRPAAVVYRHYRTPPHRPWHASNRGQGCLIVFLADLEGQPCPTMELPWLLWMSPEQVLETARRDAPLSDLLGDGAELVLGPMGAPPDASCVRLTDSQEALGLALGEALPGFYRSFDAAG